MDCPRCHLSLMTTDYEGVEVDMCSQCWGFWLDSGELEQILERRTLEFTPDERRQILDARTAFSTGPTDPAPCPKCGKTMNRLSYDESVHLVIDQCRDHGVWLDTGEIKKIQAIADRSEAIHRMLLTKLGIIPGA
ncbi:MAG: zf-TFIIB domain-containing protein [Candidatus Eisenbacteria bacterium]|uniref:Zf-TFIIB domain-containing protein n=1 Tax=Eiseniibacteriota bacterium TaxID=2212470 RepID=A0A956RQM2_UNCEI|nr:zf-TFIIB domain-containing protein [Candidatus Eisenbacteria bacterium]